MKNKITQQKISCINSKNKVLRTVSINRGSISTQDFSKEEQKSYVTLEKVQKVF